MIKKLKEKAIKLRKRGFSYNEILKEVPVAKSTLSLWLRNVGLAKEQKQRLTERRAAAALRGAQTRRNQRLNITKEIKDRAKLEIGRLSSRELWLIGIALYWAEGSKEKTKSPRLEFCNSDPFMVKLYLKWLSKILKIKPIGVAFEIFIHENHINELNNVKKYWSSITGFPVPNFKNIYLKKHNIKTNRKNIGNNYHGLLKIKVKESSTLNRRVAGWIEGIYDHCGVV